MKSVYALAVVALLATTSLANAQTTPRTVKTGGPEKPLDICVEKQTSNAELIARAQAAKTPAERKAILKAAIDADPANAVCIADLALQMALASGINPAGGPSAGGPDISDGTTPPAENPNQLNERVNPTESSSQSGNPV